MSDWTELPRWVLRQDGQREPFDGDVIFRDLFHALSALGQSDPFRARELTDAALFFVAHAQLGETVDHDVVRDAVVTAVRELGQPALAQQLETHSVDDVSASGGLFAGIAEPGDPTELIVAEEAGLLALSRAASPDRLAGRVVVTRPRADGGPGIVAELRSAATVVSEYVAIDGADAAIARDTSSAAQWIAELRQGLRETGLRAVLNLNCRIPPAGARVQSGPLYSGEALPDLAAAAEALCDEAVSLANANVRVDWHLAEDDVRPNQLGRLLRLARYVAAGAPISFVPDRARRPVALAEGLDRANVAVLRVVGIRIDGLVEHLRRTDSEQQGFESFYSRLSGLVSLAQTAGRARLRALRVRAPFLTGGEFLPDRSRLLVVPTGIDEAVRSIFGYVTDEARSARELLLALLAAAARSRDPGVPTTIDADPAGPGPFTRIPGGPRSQLRQAGASHTDVGAGTATVWLDSGVAAEEIAELIKYGAATPGLVRFQFATRPGGMAP